MAWKHLGLAAVLGGAPFVTALPVYMYTASFGYDLQIASVTALVLMAPGRCCYCSSSRV